MDSDLIHSLAFGWIWLGAFAQLVGMPIAWLRLRNTTEWREREGRRRIDILALALRVPTALTILWGYLALVMVAAVGGSDGGLGRLPSHRPRTAARLRAPHSLGGAAGLKWRLNRARTRVSRHST